MKSKILALAASAAVAGFVLASGGAAAAQSSSPLTIRSDDGRVAHIFPTHQLAKQLGLIAPRGAPPPSAPMVYYGGPVMTGLLRFYVIYWQPSTLQDGSATSLSVGYKTVETNLVKNYGGKAIAAITSQYYQGTSPKYYITGQSLLGAAITDTQPYPVSGCNVAVGPNCITDAQLRAEISRLMGVYGWTGGFSNMFMVFTSSGEGSCFDTTVNECSTETANVSPAFCAYHSYFNTNVVYSNEPNGSAYWCLGSGKQPNLRAGGSGADPAATAASHEMSEAITDPQLNAWHGTAGLSEEIGDLCAYQYGTNTYDSGLANQFWGGRYFEVQMEYNNHTASCVQGAP